MKVTFSLKSVYTPKWNGNQELPKKQRVTADLQALESLDLLTLADALERAGFAKEDGEVELAAEQAKALLDAVGELLPKYAVLNNLEGDEGPLGVEEIVKYPLFQDLALELLMALAGISQPTEDDVKN
jgi:hypothetical protein